MRAIESVYIDDDGYSEIIKFDNGKTLYVDGNKMYNSNGKRVEFNIQFSDDFRTRKANSSDIASIPKDLMNILGWDGRDNLPIEVLNVLDQIKQPIKASELLDWTYDNLDADLASEYQREIYEYLLNSGKISADTSVSENMQPDTSAVDERRDKMAHRDTRMAEWKVDPRDIAKLITENPDVPAESGDIQQKVVEWNNAYRRLSREIRLKDLAPTTYEAMVVSELLSVCGNKVPLAIEVLEHDDCEGGWMMGDALAKLTEMSANEQQVPW